MYNAGPEAFCCLVLFNSSRFIPNDLAAEMAFPVCVTFFAKSLILFRKIASVCRLVSRYLAIC